MYLLSALLLLWLPGCFSDNDVWGLKHVRYEENSLAIIKCNYASGWETYVKWWCRGAVWNSCEILVKTTKQESKKDRVSIQDNATAHTFTVTIKNIRKNDEGAYWCGIEKGGVDRGFQIEVTVFPASTTVRTTTTTTPTTATTTVITSAGNTKRMVNDHPYERLEITDLQVLLPIIFGILLVMLVGVSILAWRMMPKQRKEAEKLAEPVPQPTEEGICYASLTLHQRTSGDSAALDSSKTKASSLLASSRVSSIHEEVEYVTMACIKEKDISDATLSLDTPGQNPIYCNMEQLSSEKSY
ncbi:CMRF35-like molecule 1 isoform X1 [Phascolarctos cinereus]|uniref:CMRF35-like molecule 1 isoform X2 n=1 Tax=Phascolarctos cinereus TaxID=38626 RepID=A0A6P5LNU9_PHACI|nr:CMRF35-like molecule 1 isoform X2 [Phascolarctos cinereus]